MSEEPLVNSTGEDDQTAETDNRVSGTISGAVVQTGSLHGGVHIHQATPGPAEVPRPGCSTAPEQAPGQW